MTSTSTPSPSSTMGSSFPSGHGSTKGEMSSGSPVASSTAISVYISPYASPKEQRKAILEEVSNIFEKGGIFQFLSSTLMYQEPSAIHVFSTEDLGFLVQHRLVWLPAFPSNKSSSFPFPPCNYGALSVILWNILQESDRYLREKRGFLPYIASSSASFLSTTTTATSPSSPLPLPTLPTLRSSSSSSVPSTSWFARHMAKWSSPAEREVLFHCLRRTSYAATLLASLLSPAATTEVRAALRIGGEDVRRTIYLLEQLNQLYLDVACWVEGGGHSSVLSSSWTGTAVESGSETKEGTASVEPPPLAGGSSSSSSPALPPPLSHHPVPFAYDPLTHRLFLSVEESVLQVQLLLVELPRCRSTQVGEAEVELIVRAMYRTEIWEGSGLSLRSTEGYLAAIKELLLAIASTPRKGVIEGWIPSMTTIVMERVLQRPPYRHHPFRLSFFSDVSDHAAAEAKTPLGAPSFHHDVGHQKGGGSGSPAKHEALSSTTNTSAIAGAPSLSLSHMKTSSSSSSPLYYPGGDGGGVLEPSFGILQLFWSVKEGVEAILCPTSTFPVLAMGWTLQHTTHAFPTSSSTSAAAMLRSSGGQTPRPHWVVQQVVQESEKKALREVYQCARSQLEKEIQQHAQDAGRRLSFYQLLAYGVFFGMPEAEMASVIPLMERAWSTHLLAPSSLPPAFAFPLSISSLTRNQRKLHTPNGIEVEAWQTIKEEKGHAWKLDPVMQQYYGPLLRLLFGICCTVRTDGGDLACGTTRSHTALLPIPSKPNTSLALPKSGLYDGDTEAAEEHRERGLHTPLTPSSLLALWDSMCQCLFQEGVIQYMSVPSIVFPPLPLLPGAMASPEGRTSTNTTTPPLSSSSSSSSPRTTTAHVCERLYAPFTVQDMPMMLALCRLIFFHPMLQCVPRQRTSSFQDRSSSSSLPTLEPRAGPLIPTKSPPTQGSPSTNTSAKSTLQRSEEPALATAQHLAKRIQSQLSRMVSTWYRVCEGIQEELFLDVSTLWSPPALSTTRKPNTPSPAAGPLFPTPSSSSPPPATTSAMPCGDEPSTTTSFSGPFTQAMATTATTTTTSSVDVDKATTATPSPVPPPPPSSLSSPFSDHREHIANVLKDVRSRLPSVALHRFSDWIEVLVMVASWMMEVGAIQQRVFPLALFPSLLDTATRLYAMFSVQIVKDGATPGVMVATGLRARAREPPFLASSTLTAATSVSFQATQKQLAALVWILKRLPAELPSAAMDALLEERLMPLAKQLSLDSAWYGLDVNKKQQRVRQGGSGSTEGEASQPASEAGSSVERATISTTSPPPPAKDALFYARVEGYLHALGTPVVAYMAGDRVFLLYWADVAIAGLQAIPTPRVPTVIPLRTLWMAALHFFDSAFFSKRTLCPLLLPSLIHVMVPSALKSSPSSSAFSFSSSPYSPPPLSLLYLFATQLSTVCKCVVECDGGPLREILADPSSLPHQIGRRVAYAFQQGREARGLPPRALERGGGNSWVAPFFFSNSLHLPQATDDTLPTGSLSSRSLPLVLPRNQKKSVPSTTEVHSSPSGTTNTTNTTTPTWTTSPAALQEALAKVTPCSAVLLAVSALFDHLCVIASALSNPDFRGSAKVQEFSIYFSALCSLLTSTHVEVLSRVCVSLEALITEHLRGSMSVAMLALHFIEQVVANTTGPMKAPLVEWFLHLVNEIGAPEKRSKL